MSALRKELVLLVLQFLNEENFKETAHRLEQESGYFFNMKYFEDVVTNGELDEAEKYLSGFTKFDDNRYSTKIFFEMRKQKYLEALDRRDDAKAAEILRNDLKAFSTYDEELFKEMTMLLSLNNFREIEQLSKYVDSKSARVIMLAEIKRLVEANPLFRDKLQLPASINSRLRALINQSLNWQHQICNYSNPNPEIKTLLADHTCGTSNGAPAPPSVVNPLLSCTPRIGGVSALAPAPAALMAPLAGWGANPSMTMQPTVSGCPIAIPARKPAAPMRKRFRTPPYSPAADDECIIKRSRPIEISDEVNHQAVLHSSDDLPKTVVCNLNQGSAVNSMDFHPVQQTLLLIGTNAGEIRIWEIVSREMLYLQGFKVWDLGARSLDLQASLASEYTASVNRVVWSPDGDLFGVAYSKHIVQIYSYHGGNIQHHLEMDAHVGNVSDIAFSQLKEQLYFVTCGGDRTVKVWSATTGSRQYTFEGHESPVYSVCPHQRNNVQFIFSATVNGRIKVWLYDNMGPRLDIDAPGRSCTKMLYSADGTRVFSCGTNREGESYLVEWIESEGAIKRTYHGLGKCPVGVVHFDTARNRFLAAGDEFLIKIWAMDNDNVLTTIDAEGGLPVSPCVKFNREGLLLAVSTSENAVKVLASDKVLHLLHSNGSRALDAPKVFSGITAKGPTTGSLGASSSTGGTSIPPSGRNSPAPSIFGLNSDTEHFSDVKTRTNGELENSQAWNLKEYDEQSQFQSLRLPDRLLPTRIIRMIYTSSGGAILALTDNAVHKFWRWRQNEFNPSGKATCAVEPKLWQPSSGIIMTNDISNIVLDDANPCFALSKNDSYLLSTSGGKISLFNMMTFKTMTTFMPPPPAATCLEFHPRDNNMVAIGMEDSSIQIFNVRVNEVESKFKGHQKRVTGLAFSDILNVLVSSGADAQLCVWSTDKWENLASKFLPIPTHRMSSTLAKTRVLFHQDRRHFLVVHETQIAIYEAPKLDCHKQWYPLESDAPITDAAYSCDGMSIYTSFEEGSVGIFTASTLQLKCRISAAAYLPSNSSSRVFPVVVAAHPSEPTQFALGLSNGGVIVLEPPESERKWGTDPPVPNGSGPAHLQF